MPLNLKSKKFRAAAVVLGAGLAVGIGAGLWITRDIPEVDSLQFATPRVMTRLYARDGTVLQEYGNEKRTLVKYADISPYFFQALLAVEDANFMNHHGVSPRGLLRAVVQDLLHRRAGQGGSTLTQQLARQYFLSPEKTITRKVKEMILAVNIERRYSKQQILELYANKVCFGHGYYGVQASSQFYFGKPAMALSVPEAALLAGIIQRPSAYSPINRPKQALARRNTVLERMWKTGAITEAQFKAYAAEPISLVQSPYEESGIAPYVSERVRMYLESKYGEEALYDTGLQVYTTIDPKLQMVAQSALRDGLHEYSRRRSYRGPKRGPDAPAEYTKADLDVNDRRWATVRDVTSTSITASLAGTSVTLTPKQWAWANITYPSRTFQPGDRILLRISKTAPLEAELEQEPLAQGGLMAMDPRSGEVLALTGGYEFTSSMFNRTIQAKRQTGSAVKPLVYAAAIQGGLTLADPVVDTPTLFLTGREHADRMCQEGYIPRDFDPDYLGYITYQTALEHSVNIAAVHLLNQTGYHRVIDLARKLHITAALQPYPSMALGAFEITLWELTAAYSAFDNGGTWVEPRFMTKITDSEGKVLETFHPYSEPVLDPKSAFILVEGMTGVVLRGTAGTAADMKGHFAGKTGTTDDFTDSWFIGFNPNVVCGVWAGRDDHKPLGHNETGARVALPIWRKFMEKATAGQENVDWPVPDGVTKVLIDPATGLRAGVDSPCGEIREQYFVEGTEPKGVCNAHDNFRLKLPHFLQSYPLRADDTLVIPEPDLASLASIYSGVIEREGRRLLVTWKGTTFPVKLEITPAPEGPVPQAVMPGLPHEGTVACGARTEYINEKQ
jgi:penicillin-binding protein 1A